MVRPRGRSPSLDLTTRPPSHTSPSPATLLQLSTPWLRWISRMATGRILLCGSGREEREGSAFRALQDPPSPCLALTISSSSSSLKRSNQHHPSSLPHSRRGLSRPHKNLAQYKCNQFPVPVLNVSTSRRTSVANRTLRCASSPARKSGRQSRIFH